MKLITIIFICVTASFASLNIPEYLSANFTQVIQSKETKKEIYYSGKFYMKMPNKAKWNYYIPLKKSLCIDGETAWVIEPELEQATLFKLDKSIPLMEIFKNAKKIEDKKYIARFNSTKYLISVDKNGIVTSISYLDELENRVIIRFNSVKDKQFDEEKLRCKIPEDFDIIDGRY